MSVSDKFMWTMILIVVIGCVWALLIGFLS